MLGVYVHVLSAVWHVHVQVVNFLLVAPGCEREYGAFNLLKIMLWTALSSAVAHMLLGPANTVQLGASGIVFMMSAVPLNIHP